MSSVNRPDSGGCANLFRALFATALTCLGASTAQGQRAATLVVRNNHEIPYRGPIDLVADLPDGQYSAPGAVADVRGGRAHVVATLAARQDQL